jgi:ATP-binding cassette, subfamily B (MDR/TAP), member 1
MICCWLAGARQATRIRERFFQKVLHQEIAFFDASATTGVLLQGLNQDTLAVQNAIGEKVGNFVHNFSTFVVGIAIGK